MKVDQCTCCDKKRSLLIFHICETSNVSLKGNKTKTYGAHCLQGARLKHNILKDQHSNILM